MKAEQTQIFGLMGNPVEHSLSPVIFEYLFRRYKIMACYQLVALKPEQLSPALQGMRTLGIQGLNVTAPYKEKVLSLLDRMDDSARKIKAVNVISNQKGILVGYNTDIIGIKKTLAEKLRIDSKLDEVILIGAGGAARACLSVLGELKPKQIILANRTLANAETLKKELNSNVNLEIIDLARLRDFLKKKKVALVINSASGDNAQIKSVISQTLDEDGRVFDLKYNKNNNLAGQGRRYIDGLFMLACQAAESFRIWLGIKPDAEEVYRYLLKQRRA